MGFFDMFKGGGRTPTGLDAVRTTFKAVAGTFVDERLLRFPANRTFFESALGYLTVGHQACEIAMMGFVNEPNGRDLVQPLLQGIVTSPVRHLRSFFAIYQLILIDLYWAEDANLASGMPACLAEGACDLYSQEFQLVSRILHCVAERPGVDRKQRFANCAAKELAASVGISSNYVMEQYVLEVVMAAYEPLIQVANSPEQLMRYRDNTLARM